MKNRILTILTVINLIFMAIVVAISISPNLIAQGVIYGDFLRLVETTTPGAISGVGALYTKSDNEVYFQDGAGTEHVILEGAAGILHEFHIPFEDPTGQVGNWDVVQINASQDVHFAFQVPHDFETLDDANVIMIPDASETIQWDLNVSVSAAGETQDNDVRTGVDSTQAVTINVLTEIDIMSQLIGLAAGDYVAIDFQSDTANLRIIGFEFDYN